MDIFVSSLPFKIKESELREIFEKYGTVESVSIIINKATRQSKGYGFVKMPDEREAQEAVRSLNGAELQGRSLVVSQSQAKERKRPEPDAYKSEKKKSQTWKSDAPAFSGKKNVKRKNKTPEITFGDEDSAFRKKRRVKLAKNFKVGKRPKK